MDGESTIDAGADDSADIVTIPLLLAFDEPETMEPPIVDNDLPEDETETGPQQEPVDASAMPSADTAVSTVTAVRLGSGADDDPSTAAAMDDAEAENMDVRGSRRRSGSRRRRGRRSRSRRSRSRSRRSRSRRARSRSDDSDLSFVVEIGEDESSAEVAAAGGSRGGQKVARGSGRNTAKTALGGRRGGRVDRYRAARGGRKRNRRGRKTAGSVPRRTMWTDRLRSRNTRRQNKSQPK